MKIFSTWKEALFLLSHPRLWFRKPLEEDDLGSDPFSAFDTWFQAAQRSLLLEFPNAMTLATVSEDLQPQARIVLLKSFDSHGFVFYTNTESAKGHALRSNPKAAIVFYWQHLQRQVRIQGKCERVSDAEANQYYASRPRRSQLGAWASQQSKKLESRKQLLQHMEQLEKKYAQQPIDRPPYWSGYRLVPDRFEFWELRLNRLHDRIVFDKSENGTWSRYRLSP